MQLCCVLIWDFCELLEITVEADDQAFTVIEETSASYVLLLIMPNFEVFVFAGVLFVLFYFINFSITVLP